MDIAQAGEVMALGAAAIWAVAVILFRLSGKTVVPLGLNFFKNCLGFSLFLLTMLLSGQAILRAAPWQDYALLLASGVLGMAISDTLFFHSLNLIGAGPASIVSGLYTPFIIGLSLAFLGERLNERQVVGVACIFLAVTLIGYQKPDKGLPPGALFWGIVLGALAQFCTAVGIVIMKPVLGRVPLLWATTIRVFGSIPALALILALHPGRKEILSPLLQKKNWRVMIPASILGTYFSILIWMGSLKYARVSIAAVLSQANVAFAFILAAVFLKEKVTPVKVAAVTLMLLGALLTTSL